MPNKAAKNRKRERIKENAAAAKMTKKESNDFSIYGVFRFSTYIICSIALYFGNLEIAGLSFGFGASLGFLRRLARIWE